MNVENYAMCGHFVREVEFSIFNIVLKLIRMSIFQLILRRLINGILFGIVLAIAGIAYNTRRRVRLGIPTPFAFLSRDPEIYKCIKQLSVFYQTSSFTTSAGFKEFISRIDGVLENPTSVSRDLCFVDDMMSLLSDDRRKLQQDEERLQYLKGTMRRLLTDIQKHTYV